MATAVFVVLLGGCSSEEGHSNAHSQSGERSEIDPLAAVRWAERATDVSTAAASPLVTGSEGSWACASCHGENGEGNNHIPALAGLPAGYIAKQLKDFADGRRENATMSSVARSLSDKEMAALGRYYANRTLDTPAGASLEGRIERGRKLALEGDWRAGAPACYSCHGSAGWGVGQAFPAIAGQHPEYIYQQLVAFATRRRQNDPEDFMHDVAKVLSDADRRALADYLASRPPRQEPNRLAPNTLAPDRPSERGQPTQEEDAR
ncbi:cytochrome c4 [Guyparkeria hydrothermalis]|uniref:c-type cytochrome n=1 Tax=Guyparkeria hydrothermalis TaxID=923 RepID=UPI0020222DD0|nr:c-type cytochrome [Guyparkeria hydrothermalis]MCL7743752.1 cytochrome c4 [Guyparkeria hydrothermalis]